MLTCSTHNNVIMWWGQTEKVQLKTFSFKSRKANAMQNRLLFLNCWLYCQSMRADMTLALTYAFCVLNLTSCGHPQWSASMLDTSPPPLSSCISPCTAFSLLLLLMILSVVLYPLSYDFFVVLHQSELSEGENEQMNIIVCDYETYMQPPAPKLICMRQKEYQCLSATPLRVFQELFSFFVKLRLRLWNVGWVLKNGACGGWGVSNL